MVEINPNEPPPTPERTRELLRAAGYTEQQIQQHEDREGGKKTAKDYENEQLRRRGLKP